MLTKSIMAEDLSSTFIPPTQELNFDANMTGFTEADYLFHFVLYKIMVPVTYGMISFVGLVGNTLALYVIISEQKMRTRINLLLLNLAVTDIIFLAACVPFVTYHFAADTWNIGEVICKAAQYILYVTVYVTVYTMVMISVVRYIMVAHSKWNITYLTHRVICLLIALIWFLVLLVNTPIVLHYHVKNFKVDGLDNYQYCAVKTVDLGRRHSLAFFFMTYAIPLSCITYFYILIVRFLRQQRRGSIISSSGNERPDLSRSVSSTVIKVVLVFAICWFPLNIHLLLSYFGSHSTGKAYQLYRMMAHCMAYSNSIMNPFVYNYYSTEFREGFRRLCRKCLCCFRPHRDVVTSGKTPSVQLKYDVKDDICYSSIN